MKQKTFHCGFHGQVKIYMYLCKPNALKNRKLAKKALGSDKTKYIFKLLF